MKLKRNIAFSIEHGAREILPKALLAKFLASREMRVYLGSTEAIEILAESLPPSIIFHKSTFNRASQEFKQMGHKFVFMDEEGGATIPRSQFEYFCEKRYRTVSSSYQDLVFLPGRRFEREVGQLISSRGVPFATCGWPRIDLWRAEFRPLFKKEADKLYEKHGTFLLFPSSFGKVARRHVQDPRASSKIKLERQIHQLRKRAFIRYLELLKHLSSDLPADIKIIIRPHPNESVRDWKFHTRGLRNIQVERQGDISPWIMASSGLLQWGSTSVLQAAMFGKRSLLFGEDYLEGLTDSPSFELCDKFTAVEEVWPLLERLPKNAFEEDSKIASEAKKILREEIEFDEDILATERIGEKLLSLDVTPSDTPSLRLVQLIKIYILSFGSNVKRVLQVFRIMDQHQTVSEKIQRGLATRRLRRFIASLENIDGERGVTVKRIAPNLVIIEK